jgi:hypothetical protein
MVRKTPTHVEGIPGRQTTGFKGVLQVNGYGGYRVLAERGDVELAFYWSHVRQLLSRFAGAALEKGPPSLLTITYSYLTQ